MGLDTSHDCWHGAYSSFMRWREEIAQAAGFPPLYFMENFWEGPPGNVGSMGYRIESAINQLPIRWRLFSGDPLCILLNHSDCDGIIEAKDCKPLADRLREILPHLPSGGPFYDARDKTWQFINGLDLAASRGENVEFH